MLKVIVVVIVVVAIVLALVKAKLAGVGGAGDVAGVKLKARALLTPNELEFLGRLEAAAPELRFHGQVSMGALLEPAVARSDAKAYFRARGVFSQKIVDFVAQSRKDGSIVAVVELDDRTHDAGKDSKRDAMLTSAGYRTIRWTSKAKPDAAEIRARLLPVPASTPPG